jgi:hypothetical protein
MGMTEEEILREAGRIRANRRRKTTKACARCGRSFEGLERAKYCSDACRVAANRNGERPSRPAPDPAHVVYIEGKFPGESTRDYILRMRAKLVAQGKMTEEEARITPELEARIAIIEEQTRAREELSRRHGGPFEDSVELIRRMREERSKHLANL